MVRYVRDEEIIANALKQTRRSVQDVQRPTGTEKAQTALTAVEALDQSAFAKNLAEQLEGELGPLPGQIQDALGEAAVALAEAGLARGEASVAVADAQAAVADAQVAVGTAGDAFTAAVEAQGVADQVAEGQVIIGRTVDGLNRRFTSIESPGRGFLGYENLAPPIEGSGTWVEYRRNRAVSPYAENVASQSSATIVDHTLGGVPGKRLSGTFSNANFLAIASANNAGGEYLAGSYVVAAMDSATAGLSLSAQLHDGTNFISPRATVTLGGVGEPVRISVESRDLTVPSRTIRMYVYPAGGASGDRNLWVSKVLVEPVKAPGMAPGPFFSGDTPDRSVDPDMRTRTLATGESVMEGELVPSMSTVYGARPIVSTKDGKPAVRLVNVISADGAESFTTIPVPEDLRTSEFTVKGTVHIDEPLLPPFRNRTTIQRHNSPWSAVAYGVPNEPGVYPLSGVKSEPEWQGAMRLTNGGGPGSPDVWWTDIGIYAGTVPDDAIPFHNGDEWHQLGWKPGETEDDPDRLVIEHIHVWDGQDWVFHDIWAENIFAAGSVTARVLQANSVIAEKIAANAIIAEKIAANAVTALKVAANAIVAEKIASGAVTAEKIDALAVTAEKIATGAIIADKIAANAITAGKIAAEAIDGMTITGALMRTAPSGQRMQFDVNGLRAFNSAGSVVGALMADSGGLLLGGVPGKSGAIKFDLEQYGLFGASLDVWGPNGDPQVWLRTHSNLGGSLTLSSAAGMPSGGVTLNGGESSVSANTYKNRNNGLAAPYAMAAGRYTTSNRAVGNGGGVSQTVTLPAGRFTQPPNITVTIIGAGRLQAALVSGWTATSFTVQVDNHSGANVGDGNTWGFTWVASQMTSSNADG